MKKTQCPWSRALVSVCTKCHNAIEPAELSQEGNAGENLKNFLKARMRTEGHAGAVRVVNSSCLALCPIGEQAVVIHTHNGPGEIIALHPEKDREELVEVIKAKL